MDEPKVGQVWEKQGHLWRVKSIVGAHVFMVPARELHKLVFRRDWEHWTKTARLVDQADPPEPGD